MKVKFLVNLGSIDAENLGLKFQECKIGNERSVDEKASAWLIDRGIVEPVAQLAGIDKTPELKGVNTPSEVDKQSSGNDTKQVRSSK